MRFDDTIDGWQSQLQKIKTNSHLANFMRAISKEEICIIRYEAIEGLTSTDRLMCHENVKQCVERFGGKQVFGWDLQPWELDDNPEYDGIFTATFHSNWQKEGGDTVSVTRDNSNHHIFLPDPIRRYNFELNESYNNRVIYLDSYIAPYDALNPSRNVNYFSCGDFIDRDRQFEKYKIPKSMDEVAASLPESMKLMSNGQLTFTPEGRKRAALKFSVKFR